MSMATNPPRTKRKEHPPSQPGNNEAPSITNTSKTTSAGEDYETRSRKQRRRNPSNSNNEAQSTITSIVVFSAGEDCETPPPKPQTLGKDNSSKSNNEAPSTINSRITSSGEAAGSLQPQRLSFSSAILEEIPAASVKLMMKAVHFDAHFQVLETQFALMQNQISTLISTMKEVHSAFHDHQDPVD